MNLKINGIILLLGLGVGLFCGSRFSHSGDVAQPQAAAAAKGSAQAVAKKVTKANGDVEETLECVSAAAAEAKAIPPSVIKPSYSVGIVGLKEIASIQADARLGQLPVFVGVSITKNLNESKLLLRWEF